MRILHAIHSLDPRSGGPSALIREMVHAQVESGHDVTLLANTVQSAEPWQPNDEYVQRISDDRSFAGLELVLARSYGRRPPWNRFAYTPQARRWLARRLADASRRPQIVHVHCIFSHLTTLAASIARSRGIPYVLSPHGALDPGCYHSGSMRLKRLFTRLLLRRDLPGAAFLHATSTAEARALAHWSPSDRIRIVPLGVSVPPQFDRARAAAPLLERLPALRDRRVVLFLSRVAPIKRPELLVAAMACLRPELPDLALLVAGQDAGAMQSLQAAVRRHALEDRVVMSGFLQGADKVGAYAAAEVFVLPSSHENFGVAVVEAMAHGTPVLVTPEVATHVYVDASGCGLTVDGTVAALTAGLRQMLAHDRNELGRRGRDFVSQNLTWQAVVRQFDELYRSALDRDPTSRLAGQRA